MIMQRQTVSPETVRPLYEECIALSKIIAASRRTAAENAGKLRTA